MFDATKDAHPITLVVWIPSEDLECNLYNPNVVAREEMKLLEFSLLTNGWIQPILVAKSETEGKYVIIDGYHRATLAKTSKKVQQAFGNKVPAVVMDLSLAQRVALTIRINRAKGTHLAFKMADAIKLMVKEGMSDDEICNEIGANKVELDLLKQENVFKKLDVENHKYSEAWMPTR